MSLILLGWLALTGLAMGSDGTHGLVAKHPGRAQTHHFHMTLDLIEPKLARRATTYIAADGYLTTDQGQATVFTITDNKLFGDGLVLSANPADDYIIFAGDGITRDIETTWTKDPQLTWSNSTFAGNGVATYCVDSSSRVYIVLHSMPAACAPAVAKPVPGPSSASRSAGPSSISTSARLSSTSITTSTSADVNSTATSAGPSSTTTSTSSSPTSTDGLDYYGYNNPETNVYVQPHVFNGNRNYNISGVIENIDFPSDYTTTFPGQDGSTNIVYYTVIYQGYFRARINSNYQLRIRDSTDDDGWIWIGDKAYTAWNDTNYDAHGEYNVATDAVYLVEYTANQTLPITIMYENRGGQGAFDFEIYESASDVNYLDTTGFFIQPSPGSGFSNSQPT